MECSWEITPALIGGAPEEAPEFSNGVGISAMTERGGDKMTERFWASGAKSEVDD